MCSESVTLTMDVWIHSHYETGEHMYWDVFNVSGENIPWNLMQYLFCDDRIDERMDDLDVFKDLDSETPYTVTVVMGSETAPGGGWYISRLLDVKRMEEDA